MTSFDNPGQAKSAQWLIEELSAALSRTLELMTDERPAMDCKSGEQIVLDSETLWWAQPFSPPGSILWLGAPAGTWGELGSRPLRGAGSEPVGDSESRNTFLEIVSQSLSNLAQLVSMHTGSEVLCEQGDEAGRPPVPGESFRVEVSYSDGVQVPLFVVFSAALLNIMAAPEEESPLEPDSGPETSEPVDAKKMAGAQQTAPQAPFSKTIDLLLDVELPVSVSFGRTQLPLRDVMKLATGSIIELNRALSEPVEVIVNNCVIARGEVVVVDGNYGVRINQIINRQERLRTLQ